MRGVAPMADIVAILDCFSMISIDMVDTTLNDATTTIKASMTKVIHFSTAIMRNDCSCCCNRSFTSRRPLPSSRNRAATAPASFPALTVTAIEVASEV